MAWSVWSCDTETGDRLHRLPVSAFPWGRALNSSSRSGSASVPLRDADISRLDVAELTTPLARTLVLDWDAVAVYAGVVKTRTYHHPTGSLEIEHGDIWSVFPTRLAVDFTAPNVELTKQVYSGLSLATIAKRRVQLATTAAAWRRRSLPISLPPDVAGSASMTFYGYHLPFLADDLKTVMGMEGGPDIDFRPRWVANKLDWEMRAGTLTEGAYEWNLAAEKSGVLDLAVAADGVRLTTNSVAVGEGSGVDMLVRSHPESDPQYPAMDHVEAYKTESSADVLSSRAVENLRTFGTPTEQWSFSVLASGSPSVADLILGGSAKVYSSGDPWIVDGPHTKRIIGFSGDLSEKVDLQLGAS